MAKLMIVVAVLAFIAAVSAIGGVKDWAGNYYDLTTGQYSSSLTGKVYNTVPHVAPVAVASAPYVASPYVASYAAPVAYGSYAAPYPLAYGLYK